MAQKVVVLAGQKNGDAVADGVTEVATELGGARDGDEGGGGEKLKLLRVDVGDTDTGGEKLYAGELLLGGPALLLGADE